LQLFFKLPLLTNVIYQLKLSLIQGYRLTICQTKVWMNTSKRDTHIL
jgi:hypothetical protein